MACSTLGFTDYETDEEHTLTYERRNDDLYDDEVRETDVTVEKVTERTGGIFVHNDKEEFHVHANGEVYGRRKGSSERRVLVGFNGELI